MSSVRIKYTMHVDVPTNVMKQLPMDFRRLVRCTCSKRCTQYGYVWRDSITMRLWWEGDITSVQDNSPLPNPLPVFYKEPPPPMRAHPKVKRPPIHPTHVGNDGKFLPVPPGPPDETLDPFFAGVTKEG